MPKWRVVIRDVTLYELEIEADELWEAEEEAEKQYQEGHGKQFEAYWDVSESATEEIKPR